MPLTFVYLFEYRNVKAMLFFFFFFFFFLQFVLNTMILNTSFFTFILHYLCAYTRDTVTLLKTDS